MLISKILNAMLINQARTVLSKLLKSVDKKYPLGPNRLGIRMCLPRAASKPHAIDDGCCLYPSISGNAKHAS